jgi:hypothetical protein
MAVDFNAVASGLFGKVFGSVLYFGIVMIIVALLGGAMWYFLHYRKKFDIMVKIRSERARDAAIYFDWAAIIYNRQTKSKYFRLLGTRVDLPVPPFNVLQKTNRGDYLEIYRKSEDDFKFLTPGRIDKDKIIRADGKIYPVASTDQKQIEGDIYWYISRKDKMKKLFDTDSLMAKIIPWIPQILGGVFMIFILWILMDKLPAILSEMKSLTTELRMLKNPNIDLTKGAGALIWIMKKQK